LARKFQRILLKIKYFLKISVSNMLLKKRKVLVKNIIIVSLCSSLSVAVSAQQMVLKSQTVGSSSLVRNTSVSAEKKSTASAASKQKLEQPTAIEESAEVVIINKTAPLGLDINYVPLFGGYIKNESQQIDDQLFVSDCDKQFKSRAEGSEFFAKMGWDYLAEGDKNTAIHRFNLSWLLNAENVDPYWGLGVIEFQSANFPNAIKLMSKGLEISKEPNYVLMVDLATVYIKTALNNPNSLIESANARNLLEKSLEIQPKYTPAYMQLSLVNIIENKLEEAWDSFHKGYELNTKEVNYEILGELLKRKSDPKGIFK
jgi:tetratricopeptide (TPR) repeat protein